MTWLQDLQNSQVIIGAVQSEMFKLVDHLERVGMQALADILRRKTLCIDASIELTNRGITTYLEDLKAIVATRGKAPKKPL